MKVRRQRELCFAALARLVFLGLCVGNGALAWADGPSGAPVVKLALSAWSSCALHEDGTVSCWGTVGSAKLADGTRVNPAIPSRLRGVSGVVELAARQSGFCARTQEGAVLCWGVDKQEAVAVAGVTGATAISSSCAVVADRTVRCWDESLAAQPLGGARDIVSLSTSLSTSRFNDDKCAVRKDGTVLCWSQSSPPKPVPGLASVVEVGVSERFACARHANQTVSCWGANFSNALGRPTVELRRITKEWRPRLHPPAPVVGLRGAVGLAVGGRFACVRTKSGAVSCWGDNGGDISDRRIWSRSWAAQLGVTQIPGVAGVREIAVGNEHACALQTDRRVMCWGNGEDGQIGMGMTADQPRATQVPGIQDAVSIMTSDRTTCIRRRSGASACWGNGDAAPRVMSLGTESVQLAGDNGLCALDRQGRVQCSELWGIRPPVEKFRPISIPSATTLAVYTGYGCAVVRGGSVWCWGDNESGMFGSGPHAADGGTKLKPMPAMSGITDATELCAGPFYACVVRASGEVVCAGHFKSKLSELPIKVEGAQQATSVACGLSASCALRADGQVMCWGSEPDGGELGDGTVATRAMASIVPGLTDVVQVTMDHRTACARRRDGRVLCWGRNYNGQVGDGTLGGIRRRPVLVAGVQGAIDIATSGRHSCAVLSDGSVMCWGWTASGEAGTYAMSSLTTPMAVLF